MTQENEEIVHFELHGKIYVGTVMAKSVLSAGNIHQFGNAVLEFIKHHGRVNLLLNFERVDYLSSAVLTELLRIKNAMEENNGRLRLTAVSPTILEIFRITNFDKMFILHSDGLEQDLKRFVRAIEVEEEEAAWNSTA
jgi:anti-sigma B factor antagonist